MQRVDHPAAAFVAAAGVRAVGPLPRRPAGRKAVIRRQWPLGLIALAAITTGVVSIGSYVDYTHPNLSARSTQDISDEAIRLSVDHRDTPFFVQWFNIERQRRLVAEVARRQPDLIKAINEEEERGPVRELTSVGPPSGGHASACN